MVDIRDHDRDTRELLQRLEREQRETELTKDVFLIAKEKSQKRAEETEAGKDSNTAEPAFTQRDYLASFLPKGVR